MDESKAGVVLFTMGTPLEELPAWYVITLATAPALWTYLGLTAQANVPTSPYDLEGKTLEDLRPEKKHPKRGPSRDRLLPGKRRIRDRRERGATDAQTGFSAGLMLVVALAITVLLVM